MIDRGIITYEDIDNELNSTIAKIFANDDLKSLSAYEKRNRIFRYLTKSISYDFNKLEQIRSTAEGGKRYGRNLQKEFQSVVFKKIGICNAISQFYKLLLEKVGIKAFCVICDDGTAVFHQLNLVYDKENDCYSFDDVTSVIVGRGTEEEYFDYDLDFAHSVNQGNREVLDNQNHIVLSEQIVNFVAMREKKSLDKTPEHLPSNISSIKSKENNCMV